MSPTGRAFHPAASETIPTALSPSRRSRNPMLRGLAEPDAGESSKRSTKAPSSMALASEPSATAARKRGLAASSRRRLRVGCVSMAAASRSASKAIIRNVEMSARCDTRACDRRFMADAASMRAGRSAWSSAAISGVGFMART